MSGNAEYGMKPRFIDQLAVDFVVGEHRYMKLTSPEKRHAVHRLTKQGVPGRRVAEIMHLAYRTVVRMLEVPPPPILDVDDDGNLFIVGGSDEMDHDESDEMDDDGQCVSVGEDRVAV